MGNHANTALADRVNSSGEVTNRAISARTRAAKTGATANLPAHLTQPIKSAAEAKTWLEQHAGVQVELNSGPHRQGWHGPTAQRHPDAQGVEHRVWVDNKSEVIRAAKGIQAYMRDHPAGSADEYQRTPEGAYHATMRTIQAAAQHGATAEERAAAQTLGDYFARHRAVFVPFNLAHAMSEYDFSKPVGQDHHDHMESPGQQLARFQREAEALRLLPTLAPQLALQAGFKESYQAAEKQVAARVRDAGVSVRQRTERINALVTRLRSAVAEKRNIFDPTHMRSWDREAEYLAAHQAGILRGQAALLKQMEQNPEALPTPLPAPKRESASARETRALADHVIIEMWTDAVLFHASDTGSERKYSDRDALTRTEDANRGKGFKASEDAYDKALKAHRAQLAAAETARGRQGAEGHPMIEALKAGQSLLVRGADGNLRVIVPQYDAARNVAAGGALHLANYPSEYVTSQMKNRAYHESTTPAGFYNTRIGPESSAANRFTLVGAYKNKVAAFNALRSQPEHASHLFEAARREHLSASRRLEEAKAKVAAARASAKDFQSWYTRQGLTPPPIEESGGVKAAQKNLLTAQRKVASAETTVRNLQRLMESTGQRPKTPRARNASTRVRQKASA